MSSPAMSPVESPSVATAIFFYALRAPPINPVSGETTARGENGVAYSRKIYDYNSKESPPSIKVTRNLLVCESLDKGTCCVRRRRITPSAPYLR